MRYEFTAILERTEGWYIAQCPEVPAANGQGRTVEAVLENLAQAIELIFEVQREEALAEASPNAIFTTVTLET